MTLSETGSGYNPYITSMKYNVNGTTDVYFDTLPKTLSNVNTITFKNQTSYYKLYISDENNSLLSELMAGESYTATITKDTTFIVDTSTGGGGGAD